MGASPAILKLMDMVRRLAESGFSCVLITGESGVGKGLFARLLHQLSQRANQPFVELNCSAMPTHLVESELFGHRKGSFTDAKNDKVGLFEMADGGTLFLDEIGDMNVSLQAKLLKAIEDQKLRRIGDTREIQVDVTIVAATNQNIEQQLSDGTFRGDLYYRLNVIPLRIPPLRERPEDIEPLCRHFITHFSRKYGKKIDGFSPAAMAALKRYEWPGNVRELRNVVERGCILETGAVIDDLSLLFPAMRPNAAGTAPAAGLPLMTLAEAERHLVETAMREAGGNRNEAARILGIHRTTLYKKLLGYGMRET